MTAPVLVFGYGNPARGDDGLGPEFIRRLEERYPSAALEVLTDYQLQVEHVLDLRGRSCVYFVDAAVGGDAPEVVPVKAEKDASFTTHLLSPQALLFVYEQVEHRPAPSAWLLSIPGERFELGAPLSATAERHLESALAAFDPLTPSAVEGPTC